MKTLSFFIVLTIAMSLGILNANAQKAHTHGSATMDISIEKNKIEVNVNIPGMDLVGFEGKAKTKQHKENLKTVTDLLTKDYSLFIIPEGAGCNVTKRKLESEHDDKDHGGKGHSGYEYEVEYKCKDISKITELDVNLFRDIQSLTEITVQVVTEKEQKSAKLTSTETVLKLK